jgi:hypothetical protein
MSREPTAVITAIGAFLASLAKVAVLLDLVAWDADQLAGVTLVIDSFLIVLGALFVRSRVTPTADPRLEVGTSVNHGMATVVSNNEIVAEGAINGR